MSDKLILWGMFIFPWITLLFMKRESIKFYMPVAIFTALITTITYEIGYVYKWWVHHEKIVPWGEITNPAYAYGGFMVITMWIFYFTYRNFWLYMSVNIVFNAIQWFFVQHWLLEKPGIVTLENIKEYQVFLIGIVQALIIYGYQKWQEGALRKELVDAN